LFGINVGSMVNKALDNAEIAIKSSHMKRSLMKNCGKTVEFFASISAPCSTRYSTTSL